MSRTMLLCQAAASSGKIEHERRGFIRGSAIVFDVAARQSGHSKDKRRPRVNDFRTLDGAFDQLSPAAKLSEESWRYVRC